MKSFFWYLGVPFVLFHLAVKYFFASKKVKKYKKHPEDFLDQEKYETIFKLTKPLSYLLKVKTVDLFKDKKIAKKPHLIVANHRSVIDSLILFKFLYEVIGPSFIFVAKKELENHKYGKLLKLIDTIFIDRNNIRDLVSIIEKEKNVITNEKKTIIIFPEGTRNVKNELLDFKSSVFEICYKTMSMIQPIVLYNTEYYFEERKQKIKPKLYMEILPSIQPNNFLSIDRQILSKNIQKSMQAKIDEIVNQIQKETQNEQQK